MAEKKEIKNGMAFRKPCTKLDVHMHLGKLGNPYSFDHVTRSEFNKQQGITTCVILPMAKDPTMKFPFGFDPDMLFTSDDAYEVACEKPDEYKWMANVYLDGTDKPYEQLKKYKEMGACGCGEFAQVLRFDDPKMEQLFGWLGELDMPFLFHMSPNGLGYGVVDLPGLPLLEGALKKFPNTKFIGHSQPFWFEISEYPDNLTPEERNIYPAGKVTPGRVPYLLRTYDNLYADLSADSAGNAIMRDADYGIAFLNEFQDRLMYGSDTGNADFHYPMGAYLDSLLHQQKLSEEAYEKICRRNAEKLLKI